MLNRALQVKMVKTKKVIADEVKNDDAFYAKAATIAVEARKLLKNIAIAGAGYIVLDTFRQVMVETAKKA